MGKDIGCEGVEIFGTVPGPPDLQGAVREAARCLLCEDAPCSKGCPAGTDPAKFVRQIRFENYKGAARTIRNNNVFGYACAFTCPVERLCEEECCSKALNDPVDISGLQRFACEYGRERGLEPAERITPKGPKVAVVGAGPAGMSCAAHLARKGYAVTVFEKESQAGGVPAWGIPSFRLPQEAVDDAAKILRELGVGIVFGKSVEGSDDVRGLFSDGFAACFISVGLCASAELEFLKGYENVVSARDFLRSARCKKGAPDLKGKDVVVIGGGSVAMDAAVTARTLGAKRVCAVSLEALGELPADAGEIELAHRAHIVFKPSSQITEAQASGKRVAALKGVEIEWKEPGSFHPSNARRREGTEFALQADYVVQAIGSIAGAEIASIAAGLKHGGRGTIAVGDDFATGVPGVFAGGDIAGGGATIAKAVGDGKKAAEGIDASLRKGGK